MGIFVEYTKKTQLADRMIDGWYKHYSENFGGTEGTDNINKSDLPVEEVDRFYKMNGIMPEGCPKALQKYFKAKDSEDKSKRNSK